MAQTVPPAALLAELSAVVDAPEVVIAIVRKHVASWRADALDGEPEREAQPEGVAQSGLSAGPAPEPGPEPEPEPEPGPEPGARVQPELEPEPEPEPQQAETMLPKLSSRFIQPVSATEDGAEPLERDGPDFRANLWQSEQELRGLQREYAIMAKAAQTCQADGEALGRSERNLAAALGSAGRAGRLPVLSRFGRALTTVINSRSALLSRTSASFATAANMGRALWDVSTDDGNWMSDLQEASHAQEVALKAYGKQQAELPATQQLLLRTELIRFDYRYALDTAKASLDEASLEAVLSHFTASRAFYQQASDAFEELAPSMLALRAAMHSRRPILVEAINSRQRKRQLFVRKMQNLQVQSIVQPTRGLGDAAEELAADLEDPVPAWGAQPYVSQKQGLLLICTAANAANSGSGETDRAAGTKRSWWRSETEANVDEWTPCWCVLTGQQFSFDAHWRCIPGRPGGRTPLGDPAAAASRARAKAIKEGLELQPGDTVFDLDQTDVDKGALGNGRTRCLSLTHRTAQVRLLMQCQTEEECNSWYDMLMEFAERAQVEAARHAAALKAEADAQRIERESAGGVQSPVEHGAELACPMGGPPLTISSDFRRSAPFSLAPAVQASQTPPSSPTAADKDHMETAFSASSGTAASSLSWLQKAGRWATGTPVADESGRVVAEGIPPEHGNDGQQGQGGALGVSSTGSNAVEILELDEDVRDLTLEVLSSSVILTEGQLVSLHRILPFTEQVGRHSRCVARYCSLTSWRLLGKWPRLKLRVVVRCGNCFVVRGMEAGLLNVAPRLFHGDVVAQARRDPSRLAQWLQHTSRCARHEPRRLRGVLQCGMAAQASLLRLRQIFSLALSSRVCLWGG